MVDGETPRVVYMSARLASRPSTAPEAVTLTPAAASVLAIIHAGQGGLNVRGEPELVVTIGGTPELDAWAWRVVVVSPSHPLGNPRSVYVNAMTGQLVRIEDEVMSCGDVSGTAQGMGTPYSGHLPHIPGTNDPTPMPLPEMRITATTTGLSPYVVYTAEDGTYTLPLSGSGQSVSLDATFGHLISASGLNIFVVDAKSASPGDDTCDPTNPSALSDSAIATNPATNVALELPLSSPPPASEVEYHAAEVNAFVHGYRSKYYFFNRIIYEIPALDTKLRMVVNFPAFTQACRATVLSTCFEDGSYTFFFGRAGQFGGAGIACRNMAYSGIIAHEFGHFIDWALGISASGSFGEGFADTYAIMVNDRREQGRMYNENNDNLRDDPTGSGINCQWPINSSSPEICRCDGLSGGGNHNAGQLLSGIWLRILDGLRAEHGSTTGLARARTVHVAWCLLTVGTSTSSCSPASCATLVEVLEANPHAEDDDIIYAAFAAHSIYPTCGD
ncbi:MAG: hypothetical protein ACKVW3_00100 [Phycisphaerales bacterium]